MFPLTITNQNNLKKQYIMIIYDNLLIIRSEVLLLGTNIVRNQLVAPM